MRLPTPLVIGAVVVTGGLLGVQGKVNGELASDVNSSVVAAALSFLIGLALVLPWALLRLGALRRLVRAPTRWWWWFGGLGGALTVTATSYGVPRIGVALVTVCLVAGTVAGGLGVDGLGLGPGGSYPVTGVRLAGAFVAVAAVVIATIGSRGGGFRPEVYLLLVVAGIGVAAQQAANGQLRAAAADTAVATTVSFLGGSIGLAVLASADGGWSLSLWPSSWWEYLGGPLGLVYIVVGAASVHRLGVLRLALATVAGQLVASVVLDAAWPEPGTTLHPATVVAAGLTLVGVWVSGRRRRARAVACPAP